MILLIRPGDNLNTCKNPNSDPSLNEEERQRLNGYVQQLVQKNEGDVTALLEDLGRRLKQVERPTGDDGA